MAVLKKLFGDQGAGIPDEGTDLEALTATAREDIDEALEISEGQVEIQPDYVGVEGAGSSGVLMEAAEDFKEALGEYQDNPLFHYAYASALHIAA